MKRKIQVRRGLAADRPTLSAGEIGLDTDTNNVWIGTASGNVLLIAKTATATTFTPSGNIAATTVQAAIEELDSEKTTPSYVQSYAASNYQPLDSDLTAVAGLSPINDDILQRKSGAWTNRTLAQLKNDLAMPQQISATMIGTVSGNAVRYAPLHFSGVSVNDWFGLEHVRTIIKTDCVIDQLSTEHYTKSGAGAVTVTLMKNGVATALTVTLDTTTSTPVVTSDTTHSVSFVAGDKAGWEINLVATSTLIDVSISARLTPTF